MNILYLCAFNPDPVSDGDRVRAKWTLTALARRHMVYGFFLDPGGRGRLATGTRALLAGAELFPVPRRALAVGLLRALATGRSAHAYAFRSVAALRRLEALVRKWPVEAAFVHRLRMMPYAEGLGMPYALDLTDSLGPYYRRERWASPVRALYSAWECRRLAEYEVRSANRARVVFAVSPREAGGMRASGVIRPVVAAPNGVDCHYWASGAQRNAAHKNAAQRNAAQRNAAQKNAGRNRLGFMGNLGYPPNRDGLRWFAREVAPRMGGEGLREPVLVIGGGVPGTLANLRGPHGPVFEFRGFVPDPRPLLARMAAFVCPLPFALGIQNKALDAMAAGVPVVATANVARGLGAVPGRDMLCASSPTAFAAAVGRILARPREADKMAQRARRFVTVRYGREAGARALEAGVRVLEKAAAGK